MSHLPPARVCTPTGASSLVRRRVNIHGDLPLGTRLPAAPYASVLLSNLDPATTLEEIGYIFGDCGVIDVHSLHVVEHPRYEARAEIAFESRVLAIRACEKLDEAEINGRIMYVALAVQHINASPIPSPASATSNNVAAAAWPTSSSSSSSGLIAAAVPPRPSSSASPEPHRTNGLVPPSAGARRHSSASLSSNPIVTVAASSHQALITAFDTARITLEQHMPLLTEATIPTTASSIATPGSASDQFATAIGLVKRQAHLRTAIAHVNEAVANAHAQLAAARMSLNAYQKALQDACQANTDLNAYQRLPLALASSGASVTPASAEAPVVSQLCGLAPISVVGTRKRKDLSPIVLPIKFSDDEEDESQSAIDEFEVAAVELDTANTNNIAVVKEDTPLSTLLRLLADAIGEDRTMVMERIGDALASIPIERLQSSLPAELVQRLLEECAPEASSRMLRACARVLAILSRGASCEGAHTSTFLALQPALPVLARLLHVFDQQVLVLACWALASLTQDSTPTHSKCNAVIQATGISRRAIELLLHSSWRVKEAAGRVVGNLASGSEVHTQLLLNSDVLECLPSLLIHPHPRIRHIALWIIGNFLAGPSEQVESILRAGLLPMIIRALSDAEAEIVKEAVYSIAHATHQLEAHIRFVANASVVEPLAALLSSSDVEVVLIAISILGRVLRIGKGDALYDPRRVNRYAVQIASCHGLDFLEALQHHADESVRKSSTNLIANFFTNLEEGQVEVEEGEGEGEQDGVEDPASLVESSELCYETTPHTSLAYDTTS